MRSPNEKDTKAEISRSQRRRDAQAVLQLAREIVELPQGKFDHLTLPDELKGAVAKARRIKSHVARKRETQHVAKLLRAIDNEPIREAVHNVGEAQRQEAAQLHRCEAWRERLLEPDSDALTKLCAAQPDIDTGRLRHLIRVTQKERAQEKPPAAFRQLFALLREIDKAQELPPI